MTSDGIDISGANGTWNFAPWKGTDFMWFRATSWESHGLDLDNQFPRNWDNARKLDSVRGAYHEIRPALSSVNDQAETFATIVHDHGMVPTDMLCCAIDSPYQDELNPVAFGVWAHAFMQRMNHLVPMHRVLVYTDVSNGNSPRCENLGPWRLWLAQYKVHTPTVPRPWQGTHTGSGWAFWQTSGQIPPDRNVCRYSRADLEKFARREIG